jgi:hypothetical protein
MIILDQLDEAEAYVSKYLKHPDDEDDIETITEQVEFITDHARALIDLATLVQDTYSGDGHGEDCAADPFYAEYADEQPGVCDCGANAIRAALAKLGLG